MEQAWIKKAMMLSIKKAEETMNNNLGGPFGAAVISERGEIISVASNSVLGDHDPTAHAEINAIRMACNKLQTHDLSNYILIATAHPCPMCLSATMWSNIKHVVYGCNLNDAKNMGFRDDLMYNYIQEKMQDSNLLKIEEHEREACIRLFDAYHKQNKEIY